jgi:GT2 family glycosyltransferase
MPVSLVRPGGRDRAGPELTVVIVNYNGWPDVLRLADVLTRAPEVVSGRCEVVVVDNASDQPPPKGFPTGQNGPRLIVRPDNGGFAAGVNAGWRASRGRWLLLLNFDVEMGPSFPADVLALIDQFEARPGGTPGIVGLGLRDPDGSAQPSVGPFPDLFRALWTPLLPRARRVYRRARPGPVDWATGACLLVRSDLMAAVGGMDEDFFLYYEEVALCRTAWEKGWRVEFAPSVEVVHLRPLQVRPLTPRTRVITRHSKLLYFFKHLPRWQFRGLARVVAAEAAVRGAWARCRGDIEAARSWRAIGAMVAAWVESGEPPLKGPSVRTLADSVVRRDAA